VFQYDAIDLLIAQTSVPAAMRKLKRIAMEDLVVGGHYLRFDGSVVRRIDAIEKDQIHFQDGMGAGIFELEYFLKLHIAVATPGSQVVPEDGEEGFSDGDEW